MIRIGHPPTVAWKRRPAPIFDRLVLNAIIATALIACALLAAAAG